MRPILIGILLFLVWLIFSTWYYTNHIYPVFNPAEETDVTGEVATSVRPSQEAPEAPEAITLYFEFDKTMILNPIEFQDFIPAGKAYLEANPDACITITGHTCNIGTQSYNMGLGKRRAESARAYLSTNGISPDCMNVISKGESEPAIANTSDENRQRNRRVTIDLNR